MGEKKYYIGISFYLTLGGSLWYFFGVRTLGDFLLILLFYIGIFYIAAKILWSIFKKPSLSLKSFFLKFLYKSTGVLSIFILVFGSFLLVQNELYPAKLPLYTLSNGEKTIQFQTMSHIGSSQFYHQVRNNIFSAKKEGYVLFYEGVKSGSKESKEAFDSALGIRFQEDLYDNFSKLYGVEAQDNALFLGLGKTKDLNIDLTLDEIMDLYYKKTGKNAQEIQKTYAVSEDISTVMKNMLEHLSPKELSVLRYINQAFLNALIKHDTLRNIIVERFGNPDIFHIILEERNMHLVQEIEKSSEKNIFIIYGMMHFEGVIRILQEKDPRWTIQETQWYELISPDVEK